MPGSNRVFSMIIAALIMVFYWHCGTAENQKEKEASAQKEQAWLRVKDSWNKVVAAYDKRNDLYSTLANNPTLDPGQKDKLSAALRNRDEINADQLTGTVIADFQQQQAEISGLVSNLSFSAGPTQETPDAESSRALMAQLQGCENRIMLARRDFNKAVDEYNSIDPQNKKDIYFKTKAKTSKMPEAR